MSRVIRPLLHQISSEDPVMRANGADAVTDVLDELEPADSDVLAHALVSLRLVEVDQHCAEAQLNALAALREVFDLPREAIARLRYLDPRGVSGSQVEHLEELLNHDERA